MNLEFLHKFYQKLFKNLGFITIYYMNTVTAIYQRKDMTNYFVYYSKQD